MDPETLQALLSWFAGMQQLEQTRSGDPWASTLVESRSRRQERPGMFAFGDAPPHAAKVRDAEPLLNAFHDTAIPGPGYPRYQPGTAGYIKNQGDKLNPGAVMLLAELFAPSRSMMPLAELDMLNKLGTDEMHQWRPGTTGAYGSYGGKRGSSAVRSRYGPRH